MTPERIYLDWNATSPIRPEVRSTIEPFIGERFGNPSSVHWAGTEVRKALDEAREQVAVYLGYSPSEIVFTSGATEANNQALRGVLATRRAGHPHLLTTVVEHPSVLGTADRLEREGCRVTRIGVDRAGALDLEELRKALEGGVDLISVMWANNETGVVFPVREIGEIARERAVPFHCDAAQAAARMEIAGQSGVVDLLSVSGHKMGAPKGIGALAIRRGTVVENLIAGGPQERRRRPGTENVIGIVGLGKACELARIEGDSVPARLAALRDRLWEGIRSLTGGIARNGDPLRWLPNTLNLRFSGVDAESLAIRLDLEGVAISTGAACATGSLEPSHVLLAMGLTKEEAGSTIRMSIGPGTTEAEIDRAASLVGRAVAEIRRVERNDEWRKGRDRD